VGYAVSFVIFGLSHEVWQLFLARVLGGVLSAATLPTAMAYISDTTSEEERGSGMGFMGAAMGLGFTIGPGVGGVLGHYSLTLPFFVGAGLAIATLGLSWGALPEPPARAVAPRVSRLEALGRALGGPLALFYLVTLVGAFALAGLEATYALFAQDRLHLTSTGGPGRSASSSWWSVSSRRRFWGGSSAGSSIGGEKIASCGGGLILAAAGYFLIALTSNEATLALYAAIAGAGHALIRPSVASLISKRTTAGQGLSIGIMDSFDSLGRILGPAWGGWAYHLGITLPYLSAGAILLATAGVSAITVGKGLWAQAG